MALCQTETQEEQERTSQAEGTLTQAEDEGFKVL